MGEQTLPHSISQQSSNRLTGRDVAACVAGFEGFIQPSLQIRYLCHWLCRRSARVPVALNAPQDHFAHREVGRPVQIAGCFAYIPNHDPMTFTAQQGGPPRISPTRHCDMRELWLIREDRCFGDECRSLGLCTLWQRMNARGAFVTIMGERQLQLMAVCSKVMHDVQRWQEGLEWQ